ncbi:MAG TPA: PadR family transcriptional regulator [Conexibacter sp.]|nr:PadR family transcriptional regulator [Conexibacter sp.]
MSGLSTKHVVLGLLIERPGYGYDLIQRARSRFGFLGLSENFVYRTLERLEQDGWIEEIGDKRAGATRRGAPRVIYRATLVGRTRFKAWLAAPSERAVLRDELQAKLSLSDPDDLPELLAVAESQAGECIAELATLRRPVLAHVAEPTVPWQHAAVMMVDDLNARWLQALVDWLSAICELIEERIERSSASAGPLR